MFWNQVKCEECKHRVDKEDAQEVKRITYPFLDEVVQKIYFCRMHKRKYAKIIDDCGITFFQELRVDENGEPVGYVKLTKELVMMKYEHMKPRRGPQLDGNIMIELGDEPKRRRGPKPGVKRGPYKKRSKNKRK